MNKNWPKLNFDATFSFFIKYIERFNIKTMKMQNKPQGHTRQAYDARLKRMYPEGGEG